MKIKIYLLFLTTLAMSCTKNNENPIEGEWKLVNRFYGDVFATPCDSDAVGHRDFVMTLSQLDGDNWQIEGTSIVNSFSGSFTLKNDATDPELYNIQGLKNSITLVGGPKGQLACEQEIIRMFGEATQLKISSKTLNWGKFPPKDNGPSRDGGTFLVFKK